MNEVEKKIKSGFYYIKEEMHQSTVQGPESAVFRMIGLDRAPYFGSLSESTSVTLSTLGEL